MAKSQIEWTELTWNPVTGCDRVSAGCDHCYAMTMAKRLKAMGAPKYQADGDPRTSGPGFAVTLHPQVLAEPYRWRGHQVVFVNSMSDLFHAKVPIGFVRDVFAIIADTPQHTYQVLTKRSLRLRRLAERLEWPSNLWIGVSVENVAALSRVDDLTAHAYALLDSYVYGFALQQAALPFDGPDTVAEVADPIMRQFPADAYPHLVEMATEYILQPGYDFANEFAIGLDIILEALHRSIPDRGTEL